MLQMTKIKINGNYWSDEDRWINFKKPKTVLTIFVHSSRTRHGRVADAIVLNPLVGTIPMTVARRTTGAPSSIGSRNSNLRGRKSTVDLLFKVPCFVTKSSWP
jgi:hypothetical protein